MRAKNYFVMDTETVGLQPRNYVYDLGYTICNKKGEILKERNFLVRDVITNPDLMMRAFYAKKVFSFYLPALDLQTVRLTDWRDIIATIRHDVLAYNIDCITAYNARFDIGAIKATSNLLGTGKVLKNKIDLLCIWQFACQTILNTRGYHLAAEKFGWISDAGNVRTTAEHTYKYITGNADFIEGHTALSDALIETEILAHCFRQHKKIPYNELAYMPWQIAQEIQ